MGRRPTPIRVLDAINEFADWSGNVPYDHLSWRFCARGRFTADDAAAFKSNRTRINRSYPPSGNTIRTRAGPARR